MLTEVKKHIKLIFMCFKYNLLRAMDNKISFVSQIIGMIFNNAIMILQWVVLFSLRDNIGGYGFKEILLLWGLAASIYGFSHAFFDNASSLSTLIMYGKLDAFLVQPKDTLIYVTSSKMKVSALGDILYGFIILIFIKANIITWLLFILFAITGTIITISILIIYHSLSFAFGNVEDFAVAMESAIVNVATYPDGIFSERTKWLFMTLVPVAFSIYLPIKVIIESKYILILIIIPFAIGLFSLAYILFNKGLKRYNSGNLMMSRI